MKVSVKAKNDDGDIVFEGVIDKAELSFLIQYAINDLMAAGAHFTMQEDAEDAENPKQLKFDYGDNTLN